MENNSLVNLSLIYYDKNNKKYKKYKKLDLIFKRIESTNTELYYVNNQVNNINIFKCEVHFIGKFNKDTNIFQWGWSYFSTYGEDQNIKILKNIISYILIDKKLILFFCFVTFIT